MNISQVIMYMHPNSVPRVDFSVRDDGPTPVLREGVDGRTRFQIRPLEEDETEEVEDVHYYYRVLYDKLEEGKDYDIIDRGPYIATWNLPEPQPTEAELLAAWEELQALPPTPAPLTPEQRIAALELEKAALKEEMETKDRENKLALFEIYTLLAGGE
jgi:hypothetical protein